MSQQMVTIEGTYMATVKLPRGQRITVVDTPQVRERVRRGQVKIVATYPATTAAAEPDNQVDPTPAVAAPDEAPASGPPAKNATRDEWAAFVGTLTEPVVDVDLDDPDVGRNDLIALYQQWVETHAAEG